MMCEDEKFPMKDKVIQFITRNLGNDNFSGTGHRTVVRYVVRRGGGGYLGISSG